jgi:glycosyltransferase involved in cell wall biosynthesis
MISVIVPVYNGETFLENCLNSIENQSFDNFEVIVVDDGSNDGSLGIAERFCRRDARFRVIRHPRNMGLPAALNTGSRLAKGKLHTWISHDNFIGSKFLSELYQVFQNASTDIVYSDYYQIIDESSQINEVEVENIKYITCGNIFGASFLYRSEVFEALHGYKEDLVMFEDYDFFVRAYLKGKRFEKTTIKPYYYRIHKKQLTTTRKMPTVYYEYRYNLVTQVQVQDKIVRARSIVSLLHVFASNKQIRLSLKLMKSIALSDILPIFMYAKSKFN